MAILIDAGHGGSDLGVENKNSGQTEAEINLNVGLELARLLKKAGYDVIMTRTRPDETVTLAQRMGQIKREKPELVIGIHHNASENGLLAGAEVLAQVADKNGGPSKRLATLIALKFGEDADQTIRGVVFQQDAQGKDLYGILRAAAEVGVPAVISEYAFMDNEQDIKKIDTPAEQMQEAEALFYAIESYYKGK